MKQSTLLKKRSYQLAFAVSLTLHAALLIVVIRTPMATSSPPIIVDISKTPTPIQAVAVNQQAVQQEVSRLTAEHSAKQLAEQARLQQIQHQVAAAQHRREEEQAQLEATKRAQDRLQQHIKAEQQAAALAQQKAAKQAAEKQAAALAQQKAAKQTAEKQAAALAQQKAAKQTAAKQAATLAQQNAKQAVAEQAKAAVAHEKALKANQALKLEQAQQAAMQQQLQAEKRALAAKQLAAEQTVIDHYKGLIVTSISQHWLVPHTANRALSCELSIHLAPGGEVLSVTVTRSSGNAALDHSAETAVFKASPLPLPDQGQYPDLFDQFRTLNLTVKPEQVIAYGQT